MVAIITGSSVTLSNYNQCLPHLLCDAATLSLICCLFTKLLDGLVGGSTNSCAALLIEVWHVELLIVRRPRMVCGLWWPRLQSHPIRFGEGGQDTRLFLSMVSLAL